MLKRFIAMAVMSVAVCCLFSGCLKKPMPIENLQMTVSGGSAENGRVKMNAGDTAIVALSLDAENFTVAPSDTTNAVSQNMVEIKDNIITVKSEQEGRLSVPLKLSAKGFEDTEYALEFDMLLRTLSGFKASIMDSESASLENGVFTAERGTENVVAVSNEEGADIACTLEGDAFEMVQEGDKLLLKAVKEGTATVNAVLSKKYYATETHKLTLVCTPPWLTGTLDTTALGKDYTLPKGSSATVKTQFEPSHIITVVETDNDNVKAEVVSGGIKLTGMAEGIATVTVTVSAEDYLPFGEKLEVKVVEPLPKKEKATTSSNADYQAVLERCNYYRGQEGLAPLVYRSDIDKLSKIRAKEIATLFDHARPGDKTWYSVFAENGVKYKQVGENLARGTDQKLNDPSALVDAWMGSPSHRANIMSDLYEGMSVAKYVDENGKIHWAQLFITN